jgi:hypothetical protein
MQRAGTSTGEAARNILTERRAVARLVRGNHLKAQLDGTLKGPTFSTEKDIVCDVVWAITLAMCLLKAHSKSYPSSGSHPLRRIRNRTDQRHRPGSPSASLSCRGPNAHRLGSHTFRPNRIRRGVKYPRITFTQMFVRVSTGCFGHGHKVTSTIAFLQMSIGLLSAMCLAVR